MKFSLRIITAKIGKGIGKGIKKIL